MKIGFIGLGNVGRKLAGSLLRNKFDLTVRDLKENIKSDFINKGAKTANNAKELAEQVDLIITCLPSPKICSEVMEAKDGVINGLSKNKIWLEMSTTDESEVKRLGKLVTAKGATPLDGPVSGGCHKAATGNITIFVGGERKAFEKIKVDKKAAEKIFKATQTGGFQNPYYQAMYKVSLNTIDEALGNKKGTFESLKNQARTLLKNNKLPVYNARDASPYGFNINEIVGVSGSAKSKAAEFSQFVDVMEGNLNQNILSILVIPFTLPYLLGAVEVTNQLTESGNINYILN